MDIKTVFLMLSAVGMLTAEASASIMQGTNDLYSISPAYPYVISDTIDNLPEGFITLGTIGMGQETYYYSNGVFYQKVNLLQEYVVVPPPIGAVVDTIPQGYQLLLIEGVPLYVDHGIFYKRVLEGYKVIDPIE